jgi:alginate O-acetyltransferase complex protein AlgI
MGFTEPAFFLFLPFVWFIYWIIPSKQIGSQNAWLLVSSYFFYGYWDYRLLGLIVLSSALDFIVAQKIELSLQNHIRKRWLMLSIGINLAILAFFKYFNFFLDGFYSLGESIGLPFNPVVWNIILPVGISFYTFQTLSYSIDVYRGKIKASKDPFVFFTYVAFFPQLVAGPIERATRLLPQFNKPRRANAREWADGFRQMLWGFFKKILVADGIAPIVDQIFSNASALPSWQLALGAIFFSIQIYADFSGYSDIALGLSRLFGIKLMQNFRTPYLSRNSIEFWKRWHISLSTWFRDYVYIPLGGNRRGALRTRLNILIIFALSGLWHGANYTFVIWGFLHGLGYLFVLFWKKEWNPFDRLNGKLGQYFSMTITFIWISFAWIFFRSKDLESAWNYLQALMSINHGSSSALSMPWIALFFALGMFLLESKMRNYRHGLRWLEVQPIYVRWAWYWCIFISLLIFRTEEVQFLYFQF